MSTNNETQKEREARMARAFELREKLENQAWSQYTEAFIKAGEPEGYEVLEIAGADPTIGVVPTIAASFFSIMRRARFNRTEQWRSQLKREAVEAMNEQSYRVAPLLTYKQELAANRVLTLLCRC